MNVALPLPADLGDILRAHFEQVAERCEDPTPLVYRHLFAQHPDVEPLFELDRNDIVKGRMLFEALECILDLVGERRYCENLLRGELSNHHGLGVPQAVFADFFVAIRDTFKEIMGADWNSAVDSAWRCVLGEVAQMLDRATAAEERHQA